MAITDKNNIGKKISVELSEYLKEYTSIKDRLVICDKLGIGEETLNRAVRRTKSASENTLFALEELMKLAIENFKIENQKRKEAEKHFRKLIA